MTGTRAATATGGPLAGLRFVEMAGIGPAPLASMILADLGATGIRVESPTPGLSLGDPARDVTRRGRASVVIDIRTPEGVEAVLRLVDRADLLIEGFRPGVMERRGLGPQVCRHRNPRVVYARMTGWGQEGPWATAAGHDLDYVAVAGVLAHIARRGQPPTPPLNLVGDNGGGAMFLVVGALAALWEAQRSGLGQVVDAAMVDGAAVLMSLFHGMRAQGMWSDEPGVNLLDSGAPFYDVYATADGGWLAVAPLEPPFYATFLGLAGLDDVDPATQYDLRTWPDLRERFAACIASRTRAAWEEVFAGTDACVAPVLTMAEAAQHRHLTARGTYVTIDGVVQAAPAPRFDRTPAAVPRPPSAVGADRAALLDWGLSQREVQRLADQGVLG